MGAQATYVVRSTCIFSSMFLFCGTFETFLRFSQRGFVRWVKPARLGAGGPVDYRVRGPFSPRALLHMLFLVITYSERLGYCNIAQLGVFLFFSPYEFVYFEIPRG